MKSVTNKKNVSRVEKLCRRQGEESRWGVRNLSKHFSSRAVFSYFENVGGLMDYVNKQKLELLFVVTSARHSAHEDSRKVTIKLISPSRMAGLKHLIAFNRNTSTSMSMEEHKLRKDWKGIRYWANLTPHTLTKKYCFGRVDAESACLFYICCSLSCTIIATFPILIWKDSELIPVVRINNFSPQPTNQPICRF